MLFAIIPVNAEEANADHILRMACQPESVVIFNETIAMYEQSHPGVRVALETMEQDDLRKSLYKQKDMVDLYYVGSNQVDLSYLTRNKLILPLSSQTLVNNVALTYPQIQDYLMDRDVCWGYPVALRALYWAVNQSVWEEHNLGSVPTTLQEYFAMMQTWYETVQCEDCAFLEIGDTLYAQRKSFASAVIIYLNTLAAQGREPAFDTEDFRSLLQSMSFMPCGDSMEIKLTDQSVFFSPIGSPLYCYDFVNADAYILPPAMKKGADACVTGYLDYLVISAASENQEMANDFIETFLKSEYNASLGDEMYPAQVAKLKDELEEAEASTDAVWKYRMLVSHMVLERGSLIGCLFDSDGLWETALLYMKGDATLNETVAAMETELQSTLARLAIKGW